MIVPGRATGFIGTLIMVGTVLAWQGPAAGQPGEVHFQEGWRPLNDNLQTYDLVAGDVDGNGYLDLVCGVDGPNDLYLNTGGVLGQQPAWASQDAAQTNGVALGDIDGDGLLDLVCADMADGVKLFRNDGHGFGDDPVWTGSASGSSYDVALADIDGDGRLDLLVAKYALPNECYLNVNGSFGSEPDWVSPLSYQSQMVVAGDIDGDGSPDVVFGNRAQKLVAYRNQGGVLQSETAWTSASSYWTSAVMLADADGDGRLDLFATDEFYSTKIFLNNGDFFSRNHSWAKAMDCKTGAVGDVDGDGRPDLIVSTTLYNFTIDFRTQAFLIQQGLPLPTSAWSYQVAGDQPYAQILADFDADGDLDLASGNANQVSNDVAIRADFILENTRLTTLEEAAWATDEQLFSPSLAIGDVDGDGLEDVVFGNAGPASLYLREGDSLGTAPAWVAGAGTLTNDLALGDIDGDGDLDLVCGNEGANTVFFNSGGTFAVDPDWSTPTTYTTMETILGDIDRDGDLDLICGNWMGPDLLYRNEGTGLALSAENISPGQNLTRALALADLDGDGFPDLVAGRDAGSALYLNRQGSFLPNTPDLVFSGDRDVSSVVFGDVDGDGDQDLVCGTLEGQALLYLNTGSLLRQVPVWEGDLGCFIFDVMLDDIDGDGALDLFVAGAGRNALFLNRGGGFRSDPDSQWTNTNWTYAAVTCDADGDGDRDIVLARSGANSMLTWALNRPQTLVAGRLPYAMPNNPGHLRNMYHEQPGPGLLRLHFLAVDFEGDPIWILPRYQFEGDPIWRDFPLKSGKAAEGPFYGSPEGTAGYLDLDVSSLAVDSRAVVLKLQIRESPHKAAGPIQYSPVFRYRVGQLFRMDVAVEPNVGTTHLAGLPLQVTARNVTLGAPVQSARLHFRRGGDAEFSVTEMTGDGRTFIGEIPATHVGPRGVEYYLEMVLPRGPVTDPSDGRYHALQVSVPDLAEDQPWTAGVYRLVSVPLEFPSNSDAGLQDLLWDQPEFGSPYNPLQWRAFGYLQDRNAYAELDTTVSPGPFDLRLGRAFWLVSRQAAAVTTAPLMGRSVATGHPFAITLEPGWNLVGHPFAFDVAWSDMIVGGQSASTAVELALVEPPVGMSRSGSYATDVTVWEPFQGYWVKNLTTEEVSLQVPARASTSGEKLARGQGHGGWRLTVTADCAGMPSDAVVLGMSPDGREDRDPLDGSNPPPAPGERLDLVLVPNQLCRDIRGESSGNVWALDLRDSFAGDELGREVNLKVEGLGSLPLDAGAVLVDRELGCTVDLRITSRYRFFLNRVAAEAGSREPRFQIAVGTPDYLEDAAPAQATSTALRGVYPNPANPMTVIRFDIDREGNASLRIYDPAGRLVRELINGRVNAGGHEVPWRGEDDHGRPAATGVYLVRLQTDENIVQTRKITLVR